MEKKKFTTQKENRDALILKTGVAKYKIWYKNK